MKISAAKETAAKLEERLDPFNLNPYTTDEPDLDAMFERQLRAAISACLVYESAVGFLLLHLVGEEIEADVIVDAKRASSKQIAHLEKYMRLPQNKKLPGVHRQIGGRIDRLGYHGASLLQRAVDVYEFSEKQRDLHERAAEHERRRQEKIEAKRRAASKPPGAMTPPPVPVPKREKIEKPPPCSKCNKRPRVSGTLCEKCAQWLARS